MLISVTQLSADDYSEWLASTQNQYKQYKKDNDAKFAKMLKEDWEKFSLYSQPSVYKKEKKAKLPKLLTPIKLSKKEIKSSPAVILSPLVKLRDKEVKQTTPKKLKIKELNTLSSVNMDFFSVALSFYHDKLFSISLSTPNAQNIASFWEQVSKKKWKPLVKQLNTTSANLHLNDWAKYQLVHKLSYAIFKDDNHANMLSWFLLTKMGFDTKLAYSNSKVFLLATVTNTLYQVAFIKINDKNYYVLTPQGKSKNIGSVVTYKGSYNKALKSMSFTVDKELKFESALQQRILNFEYEGKTYNITTKYNKNLVNFYRTFPQTDFQTYFNAQYSMPLQQSLLHSLQPLLKNRSEVEAVNFLLRFTQTSFKYQTDPVQFGYEKPMFPEETLFYPYSDCEDRAILFNFLVTNLLGLNVVGVQYSGHLATAVAFHSLVKGDSFKYNNTTYTIADPTYINANVGMSMKQYEGEKFIVVQ
jgi:hypothetical protein